MPSAFVLLTVALSRFSVGYVSMARHVPHAGPLYAHIAQGLGPARGVGAAVVAVLSYAAIQMVLPLRGLLLLTGVLAVRVSSKGNQRLRGVDYSRNSRAKQKSRPDASPSVSPSTAMRSRSSPPSAKPSRPLADSSPSPDTRKTGRRQRTPSWGEKPVPLQERFTGDVWLDVIARGEEPSRIRVNAVRFAPGARNAWHRHAVGQTLHVTEGIGRVRARGDKISDEEYGGGR